MRTTVYGTIYDSSGNPYKGAIIKFLPSGPIIQDGEWIQDTEVRTTTNSYGRFEVELPPNQEDTFYFMTLVYDKISTKPIVVPVSDYPISFLELKKYMFPHERLDILGGECS